MCGVASHNETPPAPSPGVVPDQAGQTYNVGVSGGKIPQRDQAIDLQIVEGTESMAGFAQSWDDLFSRAVDATPFLSRPWISTFVEEGKVRGTPLFILGWCGPNLVALFALEVRKYLTARIAMPTSTKEGFYLGLLLDPDYQRAVELIADLIASKKVFDVFYSSDLSSHDLPTHDLLHELTQRGYGCRKVFRNPCFYAELDDSFDEFLGRNASPKSRQNLRRRERRLFENGNVKIEHYVAEKVTAEVLLRIAAIEQQSWLKRRGAATLRRPFLQKLLLKMAHAGFGAVWLMTIDGQDAAYEYVFVTHRRLQFGWRAFSLKYASSMSIGQILMMQVIRHACENGILSMDIGHGEADYKRFWAESDHKVYRVVAGRGFAGRLIAVCCYIVLRLARIEWFHTLYGRVRAAWRRLKHRAGGD